MIGIVGPQGVGKSSALLVLESTLKVGFESRDVILFKWQRERDLFESLLEGNHEASPEFLQKYQEALVDTYGGVLWEPCDMYVESPGMIPVRTIEMEFSKNACEILRRRTWLNILLRKKVILIDTPDYSKTDKRAMAKDLNDIYWLWNTLTRKSRNRPHLVLAVQKEMFRGHFFFDKMTKIELRPLGPNEMLEAYRRRFGMTEPFTQEALLTLARMSRGIFRRFLRYITLTIELWQTRPEPRELIDPATVKEAIPQEQLIEDMELELGELFPKQSDLRLVAVQLLLLLEESGPQKQTHLTKHLGIEDYAMSRLLTKLELHHHVTRQRAGIDKIVSGTRSDQSATFNKHDV